MSATAAVRTWRAGLGNQARREAAMWWSTGRWWRQAIVWTGILGGLLAAMLWVLPALFAEAEGAAAMTGEAVEVAAQFAELAALLTGAGVVILAQGVLLDDQRSGLVEWLLSKPLSRPALVLAKLAGHASGLLAAVVLLPWVAVWVLLSVARAGPWPPGRLLGAAGLLGLFAVFHLSLVLALSAVTRSRGAVLAVPLALLVGADLVASAVPWLAGGMPWLLGRLAGALLATGHLAAAGPVLAAAAATVALTVAAVWGFARQEL